MTDPIHRALRHDEQWATYRRQMRTWQVAYERWRADGALGPAPPQPTRPQTPDPAA